MKDQEDERILMFDPTTHRVGCVLLQAAYGGTMIKGWRNDPRWVEFYAKRDRERVEREILNVNAGTAYAMQRMYNRAALHEYRPGELVMWMNDEG